MFTKCGEKWRRRYLDKDRTPTSVAAMRGRAIHSAAEFNFVQKINSREDLPEREVVAYAVNEFDEARKGQFSLSADEREEGAAKVIGRATDEVVTQTEAHIRYQAPDYQPIEVEHEFSIPIAEDVDLVGKIDVVAESETRRDHIVDFKSSGRAKSQTEIVTSPQLTVYSAAWARHTGELPTCGFDQLVSRSKGIERIRVDTTRGARDFAALEARINAMLGAIRAGVFLPADPVSDWWCSGKWCPYHSTCPYAQASNER